MKKNLIIYIIIGAIFIIPLVLFIPIGFIFLLLFIPIIPYFISMEFLYKLREYLYLFGRKKNERESKVGIERKLISNSKKNEFFSRKYYFGVILLVLASIGIIIVWDGFKMGIAQIAFILIGGSGLMSIGKIKK